MSFGIVETFNGLLPSSEQATHTEATDAAKAAALGSGTDWLVLIHLPGEGDGAWAPIEQVKPDQSVGPPTNGAWDAQPVVLDLAGTQAIRHAQIDTKTEELIRSGFLHAGKAFSTSANAQSKWHAIFNMDQINQITYPLAISAKDESSYSIVDSATLQTMYATMVGTGKAHHDSGKALKDQIQAITNDTGQPDVPPNYHDEAAAIAAVNAIVDNR